jgi:hypothetical protein
MKQHKQMCELAAASMVAWRVPAAGGGFDNAWFAAVMYLAFVTAAAAAAVPSWFPKAHVSFDWDRLQGDTVSVVVVLRGTMQVCGTQQYCYQAPEKLSSQE